MQTQAHSISPWALLNRVHELATEAEKAFSIINELTQHTPYTYTQKALESDRDLRAELIAYHGRIQTLLFIQSDYTASLMHGLAELSAADISAPVKHSGRTCDEMKSLITNEVGAWAKDYVVGSRSAAARASITADLYSTIRMSILKYLQGFRIPLPRRLCKSIERLVWDNVIEALAYGESRSIKSFEKGFFEGFELAHRHFTE